MRSVGSAAPPMRHGPLSFHGHLRSAEEQLAFHDKYHDRMARFTGGGTGDKYALRGGDESHGEFRGQAPDYWAEYAKKLENLGLPRGGVGVSHVECDAEKKSPPPRGTLDSPPGTRYSPRRWETYSATKSPTRLPEESVLHRLDWLAHERSEPEATDVINLLRDVEDVLVREESQKRDETHVEGNTQPTVIDSSSWLPTSRIHDPGRPMGIPPAPPVPKTAATTANNTNNIVDTNLTGTSRYRTAPPATTPTAAPSFQHVSPGASLGASPALPPRGADWSQMSRYQQMEWYRTYYAWMMYYAQYYGSVLAFQEQQQQQQKEKVPQKNAKNELTSLKELSREYKKLALEVERLNQSFRSHAPAKKSVSTQSALGNELKSKGRHRSSPAHAGEDEYTLYRSEHGHSFLHGAPSHIASASQDDDDRAITPERAAAAASSGGIRLRAVPHRKPLNERENSTHGTPKSNASENGKAFYGRKSEMPWLLPQRHSAEEYHTSVAPRPTYRDISWLYKYEESETEEKSQSGTEEGGNWTNDDGERDSDLPVSEERRMPPSHNVRGHERRGERRSSVYERKKKDLEREKPRWCF
ncbi:hypothetical protein MOQ_002561 [Trypanosoma cruzi marinkellei]|uniref:Uncharacterized protein n=1 Tax=Trypanosoma cruzi marinkellei TaxID=85056 RepID=K2N6K0_TRYCR|nr:hypothetical protein MOQ_002561 [Trypanosoma cruzi marinkellei]